MCSQHNDATLAPQEPCTDRARKNPAGDARLNPWVFEVLTDRRLYPKPGTVGRDTRRAVAIALFLRNSVENTREHSRGFFASPSIRAIASATGLTRGSAERVIRALVAKGHVRLIAGGGGHGNSNIYRLTTGGPQSIPCR